MSERRPAAPPLWLLRLKMNPGPWRVLIALWTFADYDADSHQVIFPTREYVAGMINVTPRALRKNLAVLKSQGWVRPDSTGKYGKLGLELAWEEPFVVESTPEQVDPEPEHLDRKPEQVDPCPGGPKGGTPGPTGRNRCSAKPEQVDTQNLQNVTGSCRDLPARASPVTLFPVPDTPPKRPPKRTRRSKSEPTPEERSAIDEIVQAHSEEISRSRAHLGMTKARAPVPTPGTAARKKLERDIRDRLRDSAKAGMSTDAAKVRALHAVKVNGDRWRTRDRRGLEDYTHHVFKYGDRFDSAADGQLSASRRPINGRATRSGYDTRAAFEADQDAL